MTVLILLLFVLRPIPTPTSVHAMQPTIRLPPLCSCLGWPWTLRSNPHAHSWLRLLPQFLACHVAHNIYFAPPLVRFAPSNHGVRNVVRPSKYQCVVSKGCHDLMKLILIKATFLSTLVSFWEKSPHSSTSLYPLKANCKSFLPRSPNANCFLF